MRPMGFEKPPTHNFENPYTYCGYVFSHVSLENLRSSVRRSSPKTGKRPRLDRTKTGKDRTSSPGLSILRIKDRKKTGLNWYICSSYKVLWNKAGIISISQKLTKIWRKP